MNLPMIFNMLGRVLICEGALLSLPIFVGIKYSEYNAVSSFLISMILCVATGFLLQCIKSRSKVFYLREGFVITALSWIVISIMGAVPFILTQSITDPIDALFETVSGFTTTGASILSDIESLPYSVLFWRSFTHWIGGMGVLVFLLMLTPIVGGSNTNLMKAESPGPQVEKLVPKIQSTAKILYGLYISLTLLQIIFLVAGDMPIFDAVTITFGTAGTGGFGIRNDSIAGYTVYHQGVITVFMILFGCNFTFYFLLMQKKFIKAFKIEELRWYLIIICISIAMITINTYPVYNNIGNAFRNAAFQVGSIITTTGFSTVDFNTWPQVSKTMLIMLMFIGACAGSTGGGIKVSRCVIWLKTVCKEINHFMHPQRIGKITLNKKNVSHEVIRSINVFMAAYILIFSFSVLLISFDNYDFTTNFTAVAATLNNIGPGLEQVGPVENFGFFSSFSKIILIFDMLAGRLELFPLMLLLSRKTWCKF